MAANTEGFYFLVTFNNADASNNLNFSPNKFIFSVSNESHSFVINLIQLTV